MIGIFDSRRRNRELTERLAEAEATARLALALTESTTRALKESVAAESVWRETAQRFANIQVYAHNPRGETLGSLVTELEGRATELDARIGQISVTEMTVDVFTTPAQAVEWVDLALVINLVDHDG